MIQAKDTGYQFSSTTYSVKEVLNGKDVLTLTIPAKGDDAQHVMPELVLVEKAYSNSEFVVRSINGDDDDTEIIAELNLDDFNAEIFEEFSKTGNPYNILNTVVPSGWTVEDRSGIRSSQTVELEAPTAEEVADSVINVFGVAIRYDFEQHMQIIYDPSSTKSNGEYATKELNLVSLSRYQSSYDLRNRLYAYGKDGLSFADINDGKPYVDDTSYLKGRIKCYRVKDDRFTDRESLLEFAKSTLKAMSKPISSYECTIADIGATDVRYAFLKLELMSVVTLLDVDTNTRVDHQVVDKTVWPYDKTQNSLTLSASSPSFTGKLVSVEEQIQKQGSEVDKKIEDYVDSMTNQIVAASGGHVVINYGDDGKMAEILLMDTTDKATAVNVMRFNMGGIAFSTSGYNGPFNGIMGLDGRWFTQYLATWQLSASIIIAGILQSQDGKTFYLDLEKGILRMRANEFTIEGKTVDQIANEKMEEAKLQAQKDLEDYAATVTADIENLQGQIDGQIQTWFDDYVPTSNNAPAIDWSTDEDKSKHLGDLFYIVDNDQQGGQAYRWALVNGVYKWVLIEDTEVAKALADAAKAQDTADGKRRTFISQPVPPYDVGDLWAQGPTGSLMVCRTGRSTGSYVASDWQTSADYINETVAQGVADQYTSASSNSANMLENPNFENWTSGGGNKLSFVVEDGILKVSFDENDELNVYMQQDVSEKLRQLAQGKCITISFDYKVITPFADAASLASRLVWEYVDNYQETLYYKERNGSLKYDEVSEDWVHYEKSYTTKISSRELKTLGMRIVFNWLDGAQKHSGEIHFKDWKLCIAPIVQTDNVRQSFASDDSKVTINSGQIKFSANTLVIDSNNFKLSEDGSVYIVGSLTSQDGTNTVSIMDGAFNIYRKVSNGDSKAAVTMYANGTNASCGNLVLFGPKADGENQFNGVDLFTNFTGGGLTVSNSSGTPRFYVIINGNGDAEVWVNGQKKF